jgi:hypothetical protein
MVKSLKVARQAASWEDRVQVPCAHVLSNDGAWKLALTLQAAFVDRRPLFFFVDNVDSLHFTDILSFFCCKEQIYYH